VGLPVPGGGAARERDDEQAAERRQQPGRQAPVIGVARIGVDAQLVQQIRVDDGLRRRAGWVG